MAENLAAKVTQTFLEQQGMHTERHGDNGERLIALFGMKNRDPLAVSMIFGEDNMSVHLVATDFVKIPEDRKEKMYKVVNDMNAGFLWIKFCVRDDASVISAEDDAVIQIDSCGEEVLRLCVQLSLICDNAYPKIMKELFA